MFAASTSRAATPKARHFLTATSTLFRIFGPRRAMGSSRRALSRVTNDWPLFVRGVPHARPN